MPYSHRANFIHYNILPQKNHTKNEIELFIEKRRGNLICKEKKECKLEKDYKNKGDFFIMHQLSQKGRRAVMLLITVLFWFALYVYVPYQTPYLSMLGVASSFIGVILGAYGFSQMLIRIPLGIGGGSQRAAQAVYRFGNACAAAASVLRFLWPSATSFLLANLISGLAASTWICSTVLYPTYYRPEQLKRLWAHCWP